MSDTERLKTELERLARLRSLCHTLRRDADYRDVSGLAAALLVAEALGELAAEVHALRVALTPPTVGAKVSREVVPEDEEPSEEEVRRAAAHVPPRK